MLIDIHDVGHGACAVIAFANGTRIMIDAGHKSAGPFWAPSNAYRGEAFDLLLPQNLDSDHLSDIERLVNSTTIKALRTNPTVDHAALALMKREHGMNAPLQFAHYLLRTYGPDYGPRPDLGNAWGHVFHNRFGDDFVDTNNLSLPVFFGLGPFTILFGGDLEEAGWERLLLNQTFCHFLRRVKVFVTSHHGRKNGRCEKVFKLCNPDIAIISDGEHQYETQKTDGWYRARVRGIPDYTQTPTILCPVPKRWVLTTRSDGSIRISVDDNGVYRVQTQFGASPFISRALAG